MANSNIISSLTTHLGNGATSILHEYELANYRLYKDVQDRDLRKYRADVFDVMGSRPDVISDRLNIGDHVNKMVSCVGMGTISFMHGVKDAASAVKDSRPVQFVTGAISKGYTAAREAINTGFEKWEDNVDNKRFIQSEANGSVKPITKFEKFMQVTLSTVNKVYSVGEKAVGYTVDSIKEGAEEVKKGSAYEKLLHSREQLDAYDNYINDAYEATHERYTKYVKSQNPDSNMLEFQDF